MIKCTQCNGAIVLVQREAIRDGSGNGEHFRSSGPVTTISTCQQCRGMGVQYS